MPDLTEEEKKILRQAYEIKERIKAEELEAGEVSVDEAVDEENDSAMPVRRPKRSTKPQQGTRTAQTRSQRPQSREGYSLQDETDNRPAQKQISQPDERSIYGPEAVNGSIKDSSKNEEDSLENMPKPDLEKNETAKPDRVKKDVGKEAGKQEPRKPRNVSKGVESAHASRQRLESQMRQTDRKWEQEEQQKRLKKVTKEEKKARKAQKKQRKAQKKKGFLHKLLKVLIIILIVLAILLAGVYAFLLTTIAQTNYKPYETSYERQADVLTQKGVTNILLIGTDTRVAGSNDARSDAMIVVSINPYKRRLVMTSIMRDSYVTIPGYGENRINEAYSRGGAALLIQTIEENYKLGIDYYVQVDFFSFVDVIDAFGGVTINVDQPEVEFINGYIAEFNQVSGIPDRDGFVDEEFPGGEITLTGKQALGYARIRKIGNDFARTQRQRTVMNALLEKVKKANVFTIYKAVESILPDISTNISDSKMCSLLMQSILYLNFDMVQARVPADGTWSNAIMGTNQEVLAVDFGANKNYLQSTIYD